MVEATKLAGSLLCNRMSSRRLARTSRLWFFSSSRRRVTACAIAAVLMMSSVASGASGLSPQLSSTLIGVDDVVAATTAPTRLQAGEGSSLAAPSPADVVVTGFDGAGLLFRFSPDNGALVDMFEHGEDRVQASRAAAFGPDGLLYVADAVGNRIVRFDPDDNSSVNVVVTAGDEGLDRPRGLAFTSDGELLVVSAGTGEVFAFDPEAGAFGAIVANGLINPAGAVVGPDGLLYVADENADAIQVFSLDGQSVATLATGPGSGPADVTFGPDGLLYVALSVAGRIDRVDALGLLTEADGELDVVDGRTAGFETVVADGVDGPTGVAVADGTLWVADYWNDDVRRFDPNSGESLGTPLTVDGPFGPTDVAVPVALTGAGTRPDDPRGGDLDGGGPTERPMDEGLVAGVRTDRWLESLGDPAQGVDFAVNKGQADPDVDFAVLTEGYDAVIGDGEVALVAEGLSVVDAVVMNVVGGAAEPEGRVLPTAPIRRDVGGPTVVEGPARSPGPPLVLDPDAADDDDAIEVDHVLPGIDVVFTSDGDEVEYSFVVEPGADPDEITLDFDRAVNVVLRPDGNLLIEAEAGPDYLSTAPITYQEVDGEPVIVDSGYLVRNDGTVGFALGAYDPALTLVIDPTFVAVETAGGSYTSGGTIDLPVPSSVITDDLMIAQIAYNSTGAGIITPPAGWTLIDETGANGITQALYWRIATTSEPAYYGFTLSSGATDTAAGAITLYDGVDTSSPIAASGGQANASAAAVTAPSITTPVDDAMLVGFFAVRDDGAGTPPAGMTERTDVNSADGGAAADETLALAADEQLGVAGSTGSRTAIVDASAGSIGHLVALTPAMPDGLLLSTAGDVDPPSGASGLSSWSAGSILHFGDPSLAYEPPSTSGTFSLIADLDAQGQDGNIVLVGLDLVDTATDVGTSPTVSLQPGDLLLSTANDETFINWDTSTTQISSKDVGLFRPQTPGDYSSGTFSVLLEAPLNDVVDASVVEADTVVGDQLLPAGSILMSNSKIVYHLDPAGAGPLVAPGLPTVLLNGPDVAIDQNIVGVHLVDDAVQVDGVDLTAGDLLVSIDNTDAAVGDNGVAVVRQDVFLLELTRTTAGPSGLAAGDAALFFDGSDVGLDDNTEDLRGIALVGGTPITAPIASDDTVRTSRNTSLVVAPLINDEDPNGDPLSIQSFTQPANGTVTDNGDGTLTYTPDFGYAGADAFTYTATDGTESAVATVTVDVRTPELWMATEDPVVASGTPGLTSWTTGQVLSLGDPGLTLDPPTTSATVAKVMNLDRFASDGEAKIGAIHEMRTALTIGSGPTAFDLLPGDLVLVSDASETFSGNTTMVMVGDSDVLVFRPESPGDPASPGEFYFLLENPVSAGTAKALTVVENPTIVGDTFLTAGTFLFSSSSDPKSLMRYTVDATGLGTTAGVLTEVADLADVGLGGAIEGIDLIERDVTVGGRTLAEGTVLLTTDGETTVAGLPVQRWDMFAVDITATTLVAGATSATASLVFDGSDAGFDDNSESLFAAYVSGADDRAVGNSAPVAVDDTATTDQGVPIVIDVVANDTDADTDPLTVIDVVDGTGGTVVDNGDGTVTYTGDTAFSGTDVFAYTISDGNGSTDTALVTVTVTPHSLPRAIYRQSGQTAPRYQAWNGTAFDGELVSATVGEFRIIQGAEAPDRDEAIVVGVDIAGTIAGERWNGSTWTALPALGSTTQSYWWSFDVAYEAVSGDAMVVYVDGADLRYRVWNGSTWSAEVSITEPLAGTPRQMQLASHPWADEMVLIVSDDSSRDYALVWDGSAWGNPVTLHSGGAGDRTDVYVAYEQQSGQALVVYGKGTEDVYHRSWNGGWSGEAQLVRPGGIAGYARWTTLASDPTSDRIALGVLSDGADVWLAVWDGAAWADVTTATTSASGTNRPAVTVAFEGTSGQALAAYSGSDNTPDYRTWTGGTGWSAQSNALDIGNNANSVMLYPNPVTDQMMLATQDSGSDLQYTYWNGSTWTSLEELSTNTGDTKNQPFLFLWNEAATPPAPAMSTVSGTVFEDVVGDVLADGAIGDATNPGAAGVDVYLYEDDGDGTLDAGDSLVGGAPVQTDTNGAYSFADLFDGDYFVVVDSKTVGSSQDPTAVQGDIWAEQTYGPAGGYCDTGVTFAVRGTAGPCYGGITSNVSDDFSQWDDREHRALVTLSGADVSAVDFGFSFNVVTTTNGGNTRDDDSGANRTVQGSLRQFIQNANAITGANAMRFVPADPAGVTDGAGNYWWRMSVTSALPVLTDASTTLDGTAYDLTDGVTVLDTNAATLGTAGSVGVGADGRPGTGDEASIAAVDGPELEIADGVVSGRLPRGIDTDADSTTVRRLAIWGFGSTLSGDINGGGDAEDTSRTGFLLEDAVVGATPVGDDPGVEASITGLYVDDWSDGTVRRSYVAHTSLVGARFWVGLPNWTVEDSHFESNGTIGGIEINNTASFTITRNRFVGNSDSGLSVIDPPTTVTVTDNTFDGNTSQGAAIGDINGSTIDRNLFQNNTTVGLWIGAVNSSASDNTMRLNGSDGIFVTLGTSTLALDRNLVEDNGGNGARLYTATGVTLTDNQITGSGATGVLVDSSGATLTTNTITGSAGPGVVVKSGADGITLDRNVFGGNGGIAIDLSATTATLGDGVTVNTATPPSCGTDIGIGNGGLDAPIIDDASATTVTGRACAGATVQVYRAVADGDGSDTSAGTDYGEGVEYVGSATADGSGNWALTGITALTAGDAVASTANTVSRTSEFSANFVTNQPPVFDQDLGGRSDPEASWVSLSAAATDPDPADTLVYSATGLPLGLSIDSDTGLVSGMVNHAAAASSPYSVEIRVTDGVNPAVTDTFTWTVTDVPTSDPYLVAGTGGTGGGDDLLTTVDPANSDPVTNEVGIGTGTTTSGIEAAAIEPLSGLLYAIDGDQLGTLDVDSGVFTAFGPGLGTGDGEYGAVTFDDVRGLAFHPLTGVIWAVHTRPGLIDVLFQIDPVTGAHIPDAFGAGVDYIKLRQHGGATDYTGLAIDPTDWQLYGVVSDGAGTDYLVTIRTGNGNARIVGTLAQPLTDISFDSTGQLWGIDESALYQVTKSSGALDAGRTIDNGAAYGALAFAVPPANPPSLEGTVFEDVDGDALAAGQFPTDATDPGVPGVAVHLYRDDGTVAGEPDPADTLFDTKVTGPTGKYFFEGLSDGTFYVVIDSTTVSPSAGGSGWAEQTYGPAGAATFDGSYTYAVAGGPLFGGKQGAVSDDQTDASTAEHLARLDLGAGAYVEDVDFGFSFNVVTNRQGADATSAQGSLRRFIDNANAITGPNTMRFVPSVATNGSDGGGNSWWSLAPTATLPIVTDADTILDATAYDPSDGITAIDSNAPGPELELNGSAVGGTGLELAGTNGEVRGFVVNRFATGIALTGGSANTIAGNYIGTTADGATGEVGNTTQGVLVDQSSGNVIGGISPADRNIISGNRQRGIAIDDWSDGPAVTSGGTQILNNYIGVDRTGTATVAHDGTPQYQQIGVYVLDSANTVIGAPSTGNVISGNPWYGVYIWGSDGTGNVVQNNIIGLDSAGSGSIPNGTESSTRGGVYLSSTVGTLVGGAGVGEGNIIAANGFFGVVVSSASAADNAIIGNVIYGNGGLGIGLDLDGVTVNDILDGDSGANGLLNYPVLAVPASGDTTVGIELDVPAGDYRVEVFANPTEGADPSGFGEGESLVAAQTVTHTGSGSDPFAISVPAVFAGDVLTATATEDLGGGSYGATSEFSAAVTVGTNTVGIIDASVRRSDVVTGGGLDPAAAATTGAAGSALTFDGVDDLLGGPGLDITDSEMTVSAWIRPSAFTGTDFVVSKRNGAGDRLYELGVDGVSGQAVAALTIGGGPVVVQGGTVTAGSWHHLAVSWDGATVRLYVDGSEVATAPASGSLSGDVSTDVIVGNRSDGSAGFSGEIDHVEIGHVALTAAEIALRHSSVADQPITVSVGQQQTGAPGAWAVSGAQTRSGGFALAAPETSDSGAAAWAVATGIDEPGAVFETWWWASTNTGIDLASGTRAGQSPTDQFDAAYVGADTWGLRRRSGAASSVDGSGSQALTAGTWVKVEQWTDQNGNSRLLVDGVEVAPWTAQTTPPASGSLGLRVGQLPSGQSWYVDDPRARKLVMPEPTSTLGALDRD